MSNLCIIPARGGSKRIPRKNIRDFLGKPIIAYTIESAIMSNLFDVIMVSTDDSEIAEIAKKYGAQVPFFRSEENANDFATTAAVIYEVINNYAKINQEFEYICCCYPTAPLMTSDHISKGFQKLQQYNIDTVFPIAAYDYPIFRSLKMDEKGLVVMNWPDNLNVRSQDLPQAYHDAGQWYWMKTNTFIKYGKIIDENALGVLLDALEVQDIDNEIDWKIAELKYELLQSLK
jgi:N-acylneuraminate cytidylyltransferase